MKKIKKNKVINQSPKRQFYKLVKQNLLYFLNRCLPMCFISEYSTVTAGGVLIKQLSEYNKCLCFIRRIKVWWDRAASRSILISSIKIEIEILKIPSCKLGVSQGQKGLCFIFDMNRICILHLKYINKHVLNV